MNHLWKTLYIQILLPKKKKYFFFADLLKKSAPSRIVNVSSKAAQKSTLNLNDIDKFVSNFYNYGLSKLCNILFTIELSKKLKGTGVTAYSLHPGLVKTEISRNSQGLIRIPVDIIFNIFGKVCRKDCKSSKLIKKYF